MKPCPSPFASLQTSSFSFSRPIPAIRRFISNVLVDFIPRASGHTTGRSPSTYRTACSGSGSGRMRITIASSPNKRLKLPGPAFRGSVRSCTSQQIPQHGALAPAGVRPAA